MKEKKLKLYVWDDYNCDYTCGLAVVIAHDINEAQKLLIEENGNLDFAGKVTEYEIKPICFTCDGGG